MAPVVKLREIVDEMEIISDSIRTYLNKHTGELVALTSEELEEIEEGDDIASYPDWQREAIQKAQEVLTSDEYLSLPSSFEIHEYSIMERFCREIEDPELSDELLSQIKGSGAFRRFKHAIHRYDIADDWHRYRIQALEEIAVDWLEENDIEYER